VGSSQCDKLVMKLGIVWTVARGMDYGHGTTTPPPPYSAFSPPPPPLPLILVRPYLLIFIIMCYMVNLMMMLFPHPQKT